MRDPATLRQANDLTLSAPLPGLILMAMSILLGLVVLMYSEDDLSSNDLYFLMPWVFALGIVFAIPSFLLWFKGQFSLADPLIFGTWTYLFPAFALGGFFLSMGWSDPIFLNLIQDPRTDIPYTMFVVGIGFLGLSVGYFLPAGRWAGEFVGKAIPPLKIEDRYFIIPALFLMSLGVLFTTAAFQLSKFGYQKAQEISSYDGILFLTQQFWFFGCFILWLVIFRQRPFKIAYLPLVVFLIISNLGRAFFAGNRGTMLSIFFVILLAFILSGRKLRSNQMLFGGSALAVLLFLGMIYGTSFRLIKGSEAQISAIEYVDLMRATFEEIGKQSLAENVRNATSTLIARVDVVSTLAVVVSNYEQLKPYEEIYGLNDNIMNELTTFFIPRIIWPDKPAPTDARKYSELYFNFGESSFALTTFGDLLRNFGPIGVPVGMLVIGIILRFIWTALVVRHDPSILTYTVYFIILSGISYEGFYGSLIPTVFRYTITAVAGAFIAFIFAAYLKKLGIFRAESGSVF